MCMIPETVTVALLEYSYKYMYEEYTYVGHVSAIEKSHLDKVLSGKTL